MKNLNEYLNESLLDDEDELLNNIDDSIIDSVKQYLENNYIGSANCKISGPGEDGKYVVDCESSLTVKNHSMPQLTNGVFKFGRVKGKFVCNNSKITSLEGAPYQVNEFRCMDCHNLINLVGAPEKVSVFVCMDCDSLKSLEGAPKFVDSTFSCAGCISLTSLIGAPEHVEGNFNCNMCNSLTSLKGAPKKLGGGFYCHSCPSLTSLAGCTKEINGDFLCNHCTSLKSLKGGPKRVWGNFYCNNCGGKFVESDVRNVTRVDKKVFFANK